MRKRGFSLIEMIIVCLVIGILLAIAVPQWITVRTISQKNSCYENQRQIDNAKFRWAMGEAKKGDDTPTEADLTDYLKDFPKCPTSGTYTIGKVDEKVTCSDHAWP